MKARYHLEFSTSQPRTLAYSIDAATSRLPRAGAGVSTNFSEDKPNQPPIQIRVPPCSTQTQEHAQSVLCSLCHGPRGIKSAKPSSIQSWHWWWFPCCKWENGHLQPQFCRSPLSKEVWNVVHYHWPPLKLVAMPTFIFTQDSICTLHRPSRKRKQRAGQQVLWSWTEHRKTQGIHISRNQQILPYIESEANTTGSVIA